MRKSNIRLQRIQAVRVAGLVRDTLRVQADFARNAIRQQYAQALHDANLVRNDVREQRIVARLQRMFKVVQQFWDYDDPCQYC